MKISSFNKGISVGDRIKIKTYEEVVSETNDDNFFRSFFEIHSGLKGVVENINPSGGRRPSSKILDVRLESHSHPGISEDDSCSLHSVDECTVEVID